MQQQSLLKFEPNPFQVPGFSVRTDYVSADEERELLRHIDQGQWDNDWRRRIQLYGLGYSGEHGGRPAWIRDFPDWLTSLAKRVEIDASFERFPENCVINEYLPPLGIGPHKDYAAFGPTIACVSLGSDIVIDFTNPQRNQKVQIDVPVRSLWVITGEARSLWSHGIATRLADVVNGVRRRRDRRVSITFRTASNPGIISSRTQT